MKYLDLVNAIPSQITMTDIKDVIGGWREKLLDLSKRNRLINCRTGTMTGAVLLDHPEMRTIWATLVPSSGTMQFPWKHELLGEEDAPDDPTDSAERRMGWP